jgi:hypothetical protein
MRICTWILALCLVACATPKKSPYYFSYVKNYPAQETLPQKVEFLSVAPEALTASRGTEKLSAVDVGNQREAPMTSVAPEENTKANSVSTKANRKALKRELRALVTELREKQAVTYQKNATGSKTSYDHKKNGFAIAGFVLSILGWLVLWPLVIVGVIFSIIGLNSEKKGLAMAGLIIGVVGLVIILVAANSLSGV